MYRKVFLELILTISTVFSAYTQQFNAESDFQVRSIDNGRAVEITKYVGTSRDVRIPQKILNLPVTAIGNEAFAHMRLGKIYDLPAMIWLQEGEIIAQNRIVSVTIPNGVTKIGNYAFADNDLTTVTIPNSVTEIGEGAFAANQLTSITISNGITNIADYAFAYNQLTSVTIPNRVTRIGSAAFAINQITNVTIPNSVTEIDFCAFLLNQLISVTIPNSIARLGTNAFRENRLTSVIVPARTIYYYSPMNYVGDAQDSFTSVFDNGVSITRK
jgi:hypothetical protein